MNKKIRSSYKYEYGLVLSGGAARGFAHIGVIQALHECKIFPEVISGVSAGAIVGALYADGYNPIEIFRLFRGKRFFDYAEIVFSKTGILKITGIKKLLSDNLRAKTFDDLEKPLFVAVTNLRTGQVEYVNQGNIIETVLASSSIPVLFEPARIDSEIYVDGGVLDNLPVKPIEDMCEKKIGVHVNPLGGEEPIKGIISVAVRSFSLSISAAIGRKKDKLDIFIEPTGLNKIGLLDVSKALEMFEMGYNETKIILSKKSNINRA